MATFKFQITETFTIQEKIEAATYEEARAKLDKMLCDGDLTATDPSKHCQYEREFYEI